MKIQSRVWIAVLGLGVSQAAMAAVKVTSVDFKHGADSSVLSIRTDGPTSYQMQSSQADKQIIVQLSDASIAKSLTRKLDTSSFDSQVSLISPYQVDGEDTVRVIVQLRANVPGQIAQNGNILNLTVPNSSDTANASQAAPEGSEGAAPPSLSEAAGVEPPPPANANANAAAGAPEAAEPGAGEIGRSRAVDLGASAAPEAVAETPAGATPGENTGKTIKQAFKKSTLDEFFESQETRRFIGHPITLKLRDADLVDVFRMIAEASGFNIVMGDDVHGKLTISLEQVPWDQALDVILKNNRLGAERSGNLLRITSLLGLTAEKQQELAAKLAAEASAPRITRIFPISYAKLGDLQGLLQKFIAPPTTTVVAAPGIPIPGASPTSAQNKPLVEQDSRTNSIIVRDTAENVEKMRRLIEVLDTQTAQVFIEGKIVEVSDTYADGITGQLGFGRGSGNNTFLSSFNGGNPLDPLIGGTSAQFGSGASFASAAGAGGNFFGFSPTFAFLPGNLKLNALLNINEADQKVRVVSSPRVVVLDKESANVLESTPVLVNSVVTTANGPQLETTTVQANLSLSVTPTVTNEGSVLLQLSLSRDVPFSGTGVGNRNVSTRVLVDSGSTLVIGGIYDTSTTDTSDGLPFLRKIPIIGALFGTQTSSSIRSELFFFITPRILNPKEAGLSG